MKVPKLFKSVRYSLAAINALFLLTGIVSLITGIVVLVLYNQYNTFLTGRFFTLPSFAIAIGVIIIFTAVLGFYGAMSEQFYFIAGYVGFLLIILIFEIATTIMGFNLQSDTTEIRSPMVQNLQQYENRIGVAVLWDDLQMGFQCCGVAGIHDWPSNRFPVSCCHIDFGTISPFQCSSLNAYREGCATKLGTWLAYYAFVIGVIGSIVTSLQILMTAGAAWLAYRSRFEEVELES